LSATPRDRYEAHVERIARGAGITSLGQAIGRLLNFATQVALARMYGPLQLGLYVLGFTTIQLSGILTRFGMDSGVIRYVAHYRAERDTSRVRGTILLALWTTFGVSLLLSVGIYLSAGFLAATVFDEPFLKTVLRLFSISLPFLTVMVMALSATQGFRTVKYRAYVYEIQQPLLNLVFVSAFYLAGARILGAAVAYILSMAAGAALALYYLRRIFPELFDRNTPPKFEARELFSVSVPLVAADVTQRTGSWIAVAALGIWATTEAVGVFNAAARTAALSSLVLGAFRIFWPMISDLYSRGQLEDLRDLYRDVSRWTFTGSLAVFLVTVLLAKDIMAVFGPEFVSGWVAMVVVAGAQLFSSSVGHTGRILAMTGHQNTVMLATFGSGVTSIAASVALVPFYGMLGAGVAMAGGLVLLNIVTLVRVRQVLGVWPYNREYLKPLIAGLLAASGAFLLRSLAPTLTGLPAIGVFAPLFLMGFFGLLLVFGLNPSDRQLIAALWTAVRRTARRNS
jgi:O-antigen/teichoic acid export membrane protein